MNLERQKLIGLLAIPFFLIITTILFFLNDRTVFEPPFLLPILNTIFIGLIPLSIAAVAYKGYRVNGSGSILLLGAGMLVFGLGSIAAGWLNGLPGGSNITPTIHNVSVCLGSIFSLTAVILVLASHGSERNDVRSSLPFFLFGVLVAFVTLFSLATVLGLVPPFFIQGTGPTDIRQVILSNATAGYSLAAILFSLLYSRRKDAFFFWFSVSFALIAIGLVAIFLQPSVGSLLGWAGRGAQYLGAVLALIAVIDARDSATREGVPLSDRISRFFGSEETTSAILAASQESIWLFGADSTLLMGNPVALERLGKTAGEVIGHRFEDVLSPELAGSRRERLEETIRTRQPVRFFDERDGISFEHTFYPVFVKTGAVTGVASFSRDITERKRAREALQESEFRYRTVANNTYDFEFWTDPEGRFLYVSPSCQRVYGRASAEFLADPVLRRSVIFPGDLAAFDRHLAEDEAKRKPGSLEFRILRPDGTQCWISHVCQPVYDGDGRYLGVRGSNRDVTIRKRAEEALLDKNEQLNAINEELNATNEELTSSQEELHQSIDDLRKRELALRESEARLSLAQLAAGAGTWDWDVRTGEIIWSENLYGLFGIDPTTSPASFGAWNTIMHPDDKDGANARIVMALEQHTDLDSEYRIIRPDGEVRWINARGRGVYDTVGKPVRMYGICIDFTGRKRVEEALQESKRDLQLKNSQLQALFDYSNASLALFDAKPPYTVLAHNKYYQQLWAEPFRSQGLVGKNLNDYVPGVEVQGVWEIYDEVVRTGHAKNLVGFPYDGMERGRTWWNWHLSPIFQGDKVIGLAHMAVDVTREAEARFRLEEAISALHESEEKFREIAEAMPHIVWVTRADGWNIYFNQQWVEYTGMSLEESCGHGWNKPFHPDDQKKAWDAWQNAVNYNTPYSLESRLMAADGSYRWWLVQGVPVYYEPGKIAKWIGTCTDIEEMKQAENALVESGKTFSELIERAPFGIYVVDSQFRLARMNIRSQENAFRNVKPLIGRDFNEVMRVLWPEDVAADITGHFRHTLETGEAFYAPRFTNTRNDIEIVESYEWELHRMTLPDGQYGVICYYFDSTDLRNAEDALVKKNEDLNASYEEIAATQEELKQNVEELTKRESELNDALAEKEVLLAEIHHRVKNNLTAFISLLSLEGAYDESPAGLALKKDLQNRARSMALIHETLYQTHKFSSVDMGLYLTTLVGQIVKSYESAKTVNTVIDAGGVTLDLARATPAGLIINELITNSLKYAFPPSFDCEKVRGTPRTISVRLARDDCTYELTVGDNGIGLKDDFDLATTRTLGLKLVNFLARHQMRATIGTNLSGGTEFRFLFRDE